MQHVGLISIVFAWTGLLFLIRRWPGDRSMTFSQHAAQYPASRWYYAVMWTFALPPFTLFLLRWFSPEFSMGTLFDVLVVLASAGMVVAAYTPETTGWKVTVHRFAAFFMATLMLPMTILITLNQNVAGTARVFAVLSSVVMLGQIVFLSKHGGYHPKMLMIQASYTALFHASVLAATYL